MILEKQKTKVWIWGFLCCSFFLFAWNCDAKDIFLISDSIPTSNGNGWKWEGYDNPPTGYENLSPDSTSGYGGKGINDWSNDSTDGCVIDKAGYNCIPKSGVDYLVTIAINDLGVLYGYTNGLDDIIALYESFFNKLKTDNPDGKIIYATVYPFHTGSGGESGNGFGSFGLGEKSCDCTLRGVPGMEDNCNNWDKAHPGQIGVDCEEFLNTNYQEFIRRMKAMALEKGVIFADTFQRIIDQYEIDNTDDFANEYLGDVHLYNLKGAAYYDNFLRPELEEALTLPTISNNGSSSDKNTATLSVQTSKKANCKYSENQNTTYVSMANTFKNTDSTSHSTEVSIEEDKDYNYYVRCADDNNNITDELKISFFAQLSISHVDYSSDTDSITVKWKTNNDADSKVKYGKSSDNLNHEKSSSDNESDHKLVLKNLDPDTKYYFKIYSQDENDSEDSSKTYSIKTDAASGTSSLNTLSSLGNFSSTSSIKRKYQLLPISGTGDQTSNTENNSQQTAEEKLSEIAKNIQQTATQFFTSHIFKRDNQTFLAEVKFKILNRYNVPIPSLPVTIHSDTQETTTDDNGIATFKDIPTGQHTLSFAYNNTNFSKKVAIAEPKTEGDTVQAEVINIKAEKDPTPSWVWKVIVILSLIIVALVFVVFYRRKKNT